LCWQSSRGGISGRSKRELEAAGVKPALKREAVGATFNRHREAVAKVFKAASRV
jgi:hypothetical protein